MRRLELRGVGDADRERDLERLVRRALGDEQVRTAARVAQLARVVVSLEFELVAKPLPERDGLAPVMGLDEEALDAVTLHVSSVCGGGRRGGRGARRRRSPTAIARSRQRDA